nr:reverse transcriptase domain-containing protein [Tanacetum cinerariifolium]
MSTPSARNLFPPLDNPELTIRRRSHFDPTLLNNSKMVAEGPGDLPVPDPQTMEELCQPSLNGRGGPISPIAIQATNFGLKNDMIHQVQNPFQFHGLPGDDANKYLDKFLHVTQSIKVNGVTDDALRLYLFPHSLTHHATAWFDRLPRNSINTFEQMAKMFLMKYFSPSMVTKLRNEITNFRQRLDESLFEAWERHKISIDRSLNHNMCPKECYDLIENMTAHHNDWDTLAQRSESSSSINSSFDTKIAALKAEMAKINKNLMRVLQVNQQVKAVTPNCETCGGPHSFFDFLATVGNTQNVYAAGAYQGIKEIIILRGTTRKETNSSRELTKIPQPQFVTTNEITNFMKENDAILKNMQTNMTSLTNSNLELKNMFGQFMKMNTALSLSSGTLSGNIITNPKEDLKGITTCKGSAYPGPTIPTTSSSLVVERETEATKDTTPLNEHCSAVLLKKLPEKLGDPGKFLIPYDFPGMAECLALADLDVSINLMPLSMCNKLSLPDLSPTCMTLELADHLISCLVGVAEDVFIKVGTFHFSVDFIVFDFDADPRVPLILRRSFLKTERALIDMFEGQLTLRVGKEAITFNPDQTSRYSANYNDMMAKRIDVACEEYSDFLLEEVDAFLALEDDPTSPEVDQSYVDSKGDILLLEAFMNDDPLLPPLNQGNYLPKVQVELKDLPPLLEYVFLEGDDKLPVIIMKDLSIEEKTALITVLKSHKRAIAWKLSDIKGIDPKFCTHLNLVEEDFKPAPSTLCTKKGGFTGVENEENELIPTRLVMGWRICIDYHKLNEATRKDHFPLPFMDQMLERLAENQYYCFLDGFFRKLTEAPILIAPDWDIPFELMCDASDFAIGAVLGQRQEKHFRPIHYAKGAENLATGHLSRLENLHQNVLDPKEINESFPLETLNLVSTHDTPPSPTHDTPFTEITTSTQRSPVIPRRRVMILSPGQPIPHGRPYRYHLNGPVHMMNARKRVRTLPVQQLSVRYPVDHSSSDSSSRHSSSDHSSPDLQSTSAGPSRKRRRSHMTSVPVLPLVSRALSPVRADLIPPPNRVRDIGYLADVEDDPRETRVEKVAPPAMPEDIPEPA